MTCNRKQLNKFSNTMTVIATISAFMFVLLSLVKECYIQLDISHCHNIFDNISTYDYCFDSSLTFNITKVPIECRGECNQYRSIEIWIIISLIIAIGSILSFVIVNLCCMSHNPEEQRLLPL